jgi:hypothetical protein
MKLLADTSQLDSAIESSQDAVKDLGTTGQSVMGGLDRLTGGLASQFYGAAKGVKTFIKGLNLTKVAIIGTGIGALVIALGAVVTYFTKSFEGARKFKVILEGVSAGVQVVVDRVSKFGEAVFKFFSGDTTGAVNAFKDATASLGDELEREILVARALERARQNLVDRQREQLVTTARERAEIKALNLLAEDTTANIHDRISAAEEAGAKERALFEERKANAESELQILKAQNDLGNSTEEDRQRQAELEARIFELTSESLEMQTTLQNKLNTLKLESINLTRQQLQAEIDLANETVKAMEERQAKELETLTVTQETADKTLQVSTTNLAQQVLGTETAEETKRRLNRETLEDFLNGVELVGLQSLELAQGTLDTLTALNDSFGAANIERQSRIDGLLEQAAEATDENEKARLLDQANELAKIQDKEGEKQFERGKKIQIAQTIISTYEGATQAFKSLAGIPIIGPGLGIAAAAAAVAAGFNNVKAIKATKFEKQATSETNAYSGISTGGGPSAPTTPQLDLGFLGGGAGQTGFRTYVVSSEVTTAQQANQRINDQASLVG